MYVPIEPSSASTCILYVFVPVFNIFSPVPETLDVVASAFASNVTFSTSFGTVTVYVSNTLLKVGFRASSSSSFFTFKDDKNTFPLCFLYACIN